MKKIPALWILYSFEDDGDGHGQFFPTFAGAPGSHGVQVKKRILFFQLSAVLSPSEDRKYGNLTLTILIICISICVFVVPNMLLDILDDHVLKKDVK